MKLTVIGAGYVGLSLSVLFAHEHDVTIVDIIQEKVDKINARMSPLKDSLIDDYFKKDSLVLRATLDLESALLDTDLIIIATPTDYDEITQSFNTQSIEEIIAKSIQIAPNATILIKSTVPVSFTRRMNQTFGVNHIIFSPEFLKEGTALHDNIYPSRIIVSGDNEHAKKVASLLLSVAHDKNTPVLYMPSDEAESTKLFANAYLAMRVAFFNELDTYAEMNGLNAKALIEGISLDPRIGKYYNNPSFGYGGYCLPKDTKQLCTHFNKVPSALIQAITVSNKIRIDHIAKMIKEKNAKVIGFYRLISKKGSDNIKSSIIKQIIDKLNSKDISILIYEPLLSKVDQGELVSDFDNFVRRADIIITNRMDNKLKPYKAKVYTRDIYHIN